MMRRVAVVVVVVLWAQAVWAQLLFRNSGGVPYLASQGSAWSSGQCLVVDASGETATFGSCSAGTGDITDVWSCSTGNCNTLTAAAGDSLDCGSADSCSPMPRSTTLPGTCTEGQMYQDTDSGGAELYVCTAANTWTSVAGAGGGAPTNAQYVTLALNGTLDSERVLTQGTGITVTDGGANSTATIAATLGTAIDTSEITDATIAQVDINDTATLAGDPAFGDSSVWFATTGLIFEGETSNTSELLLIAPDVGSDVTITLPSTTGTLVGTGDTGSVTTTMIANSTITSTDMDMTSTYSFSAGGLVVPTNTAANCATGTLEGSTCWATDTDKLYMGTSSAMKVLVDTDSTQVLSNKSHDETSTSTALANVDNFSATITADPASASSSGFRSIYANATSSSAQTVLGLIGVRGDGTWAGSSANTSGLVVGVQGFATKTSTGALGSLYGLYASVGNTNGTGAVTNAYGLYVADSTTTGTITNDYAIYSAGGEQSRLGGRLGVGGVDPKATLHASQATIGNEVMRVESVATNDDPVVKVYQSRATAAASATTNIDFPLTTAAPTDAPCPSDSVCLVQAITTCHCTSGSSCTADAGGGNGSAVVVKNDAGTIAIQGAVEAFISSKIGSSSLTSLTLSISGNNARMAVIVPANFNHTCHVTWTVQSVGT